MNKKLFIISVLYVVLLGAVNAYGVTLALMPVEDLSQGRNGVNFALTEFLQKSFEKKGFNVIPSRDMIDFLGRNRMRWLGFIETNHIFQLREELGADLVIYGTISQRQELPMAAIGMVLTCARTSDGKVIWTEAGGRSKADISNFLALNEPQSMDELLPFLAEDLLKTWPAIIEQETGKQCALIEKTTLSPRHVKPGDMVQCSVKLCLSGGEEAPSQLLLMVGDDNYLQLVEKTDNNFSVTWFAPDLNGSLPVSLVLVYPSADKQVFYVGSYQIDNSAPKLVLKMKGMEVQNTVTFKGSIVIVPLWQDPEPASRWTLKVKNSGGETIAGNEGKGNLPKRFTWKGKRQDGRKADDGVYEIIVQVWDRAENVATATRKVFLRNNPPTPQITASIATDGIGVQLANEDGFPVGFWSAEVMYSDGEMVMQDQGENLPVSLLVPYPAKTEERKLECLIIMKDVLGNRAQKKIDNLMQFVHPEEQAEKEKQEEWISEF
ncbi:MAG: hypothetical protein V1706_06785 [Pseudomonadota bacterium]